MKQAVRIFGFFMVVTLLMSYGIWQYVDTTVFSLYPFSDIKQLPIWNMMWINVIFAASGSVVWSVMEKFI